MYYENKSIKELTEELKRLNNNFLLAFHESEEARARFNELMGVATSIRGEMGDLEMVIQRKKNDLTMGEDNE